MGQVRNHRYIANERTLAILGRLRVCTSVSSVQYVDACYLVTDLLRYYVFLSFRLSVNAYSRHFYVRILCFLQSV